jgi:hypothetical protein
MTRHVGKTARLRRLPTGSQGLELVETADSLRGVEPLYDEALRPQFHFSQMRGWHNDVNESYDFWAKKLKARLVELRRGVPAR